MIGWRPPYHPHTSHQLPPSAPPLQAELQKEVERAKKLAEAEGRIKENRENEDVNRRAALLK
jgi:ATPase family AAA domain-containing protein 3A/B